MDQPGALTIFIDGLCPFCRWEGDLLRRLDRGRGRLNLVDITAQGFDGSRYGLTMDELMGQIHAIDGANESASRGSAELVTGMEVFRRAYRRVGWGWLWAPTGWPVLKPLFDAFYRWFARNRLRLSGQGHRCEGDRCRVN